MTILVTALSIFVILFAFAVKIQSRTIVLDTYGRDLLDKAENGRKLFFVKPLSASMARGYSRSSGMRLANSIKRSLSYGDEDHSAAGETLSIDEPVERRQNFVVFQNSAPKWEEMGIFRERY